jgi:Uma2 family endonuclease
MSPATETAFETDQEYEFVDGHWEAKEMGSSRHGGVSSRLLARMLMHVETNHLGGVYGPDTSFQVGHNERLPDVSFLSAARIPEQGETDGKWPVAPDLAVEVISPNDVWSKVKKKLREYFAAGVQQVWLISLEERQVEIYDSPTQITVLTEDDELTNEKLLPGFRCRVSELFQQPARQQ